MIHQGSGRPIARHRVVILGASARAMAESAAAAGWDVHAADLFGDLDLRAVATDVIRVAGAGGYPESLAAAAETFPPGPYCYTGAIENHPALIERLAASRPLAGTPASVVRSVRDPVRLSASLHAAGLRFPNTMTEPLGVPTDGSFLVKPLASAAGRGIRPWTSSASNGDPGPPTGGRVWQRRVAGVPHAAAFIIGRDGPRLLGITRQLIGEPWCHASPFGYCGSVVIPKTTIPAGLSATLTRLGEVLSEAHGCVGAVGVDLVIDDDGTPWVIEVNPRFTASMELHERSTGESVAAAHLHACGIAHTQPPCRPVVRAAWSKAVLHAPREIDVTDSLIEVWRGLSMAWSAADGGPPSMADIPAPGQTIPKGSPLLTVFAGGHDPERSLAETRFRAAQTLAACWPDVSLPSAAAPTPSRHAARSA